MYSPSLESFKSFYASDPLIVLDTNIYLDLLRYSKAASTEILSLLQEILAKIFVPVQVRDEFFKNLPAVSGQRIGDIKKANMELKLSIEACKSSISTQLDLLNKRGFDKSQEIASNAIAELEKIKSCINNFIHNDIVEAEDFLSDDVVNTFFQSLCSLDDTHYPPSKLLDIYKDGYYRYKYRIPPGYMDDPQINKDSSKDGVSIIGDLIMWNQIIDIAKTQNRAVIFVTADIKEDWFEFRGKQPISPRHELIYEFEERANGFSICILTAQLFIEYLGDILSINMDAALLEMQMDDFADIQVRNKQLKILDAIVVWANTNENILQFPFVDEVNKLVKISNPHIVVKNVALQTSNEVMYLVLLEGTADFTGVYYDEELQRYLSGDIESSFLFDARISFKRPYTDTDVNDARSLANDISDISIDRVILEPVPDANIPLESKRGKFVLPNDDDYEVYAYMLSVWEIYESKHSVDAAEAFVFFDAANHFESTLLDMYRSFSLVQNQQTKINLSLNEIDALALKRFSDIRISVDDAKIATFRGESALLGEAHPTPENMLIPPPETGKELLVEFSCYVEQTDNAHVVVKGETSLPADTLLMITLSCKEHAYIVQSKTSVQSDGSLSSEPFSSKKNQNGSGLMAGKYNVEITVPIVNVQPDSVKLIMGRKGRNLVGELVKEDSITGKTVNYSFEHIIS
jgi:hypothetical protein